MDSKFMQIKKQIELKKDQEKTKTLQETVENPAAFKQDMAKFYGVNPGATRDIDLKQFTG